MNELIPLFLVFPLVLQDIRSKTVLAWIVFAVTIIMYAIGNYPIYGLISLIAGLILFKKLLKNSMALADILLISGLFAYFGKEALLITGEALILLYIFYIVYFVFLKRKIKRMAFIPFIYLGMLTVILC